MSSPTIAPPGSYVRHPVDDMEPADELDCDPEVFARIERVANRRAYRDAASKLAITLNFAMLSLHKEGMSRTVFWQICFAFGLPLCDGRSQTSLEDELGVERATISKGVKKIQRSSGLPPSAYQKPASAIGSYSDARENQLPE